MNLAKKLWMTTGDSSGGGPAPSGGYVDDVFSTYAYKGDGAYRSFVTGQNLLADGGMVWIKGRSGGYGPAYHYLFHTERGHDVFLSTNTPTQEGEFTAGMSVSSFNNDGFSLGVSSYVNDIATEYVSWVFKNAPKFYGHQVVTKSTGSNASVNFPELGELGMVRVKSISGAGSWYVWHRSLPSGQLLVGETTAAPAVLGHVTVSGTTVTLVNSVIADAPHLVEAYAHDPSADGIIQCGSFTTDGSGNATVNLGWEPQYLMYKLVSTTGNWEVIDDLRGWGASGQRPYLRPNTSDAEVLSGSQFLYKTATGFGMALPGWANQTVIYLAIRRPNKPPTSGAQVYNAIAQNGTNLNELINAGLGSPADCVFVSNRNNGNGTPVGKAMVAARLTGIGALRTNDTNAEFTASAAFFQSNPWDNMVGVSVSSGNAATNDSASTFINHFFRRAPGFFDVVCDTGTGVYHTIAHNLAKAPELIIRKSRSAVTQWEVWHSALAATEKLVLNSSAAKVTDTTAWGSTLPTATQFTAGTGANVNANTATFVTYLFATLPGISKVGSYSGNGGTQTIPCGFTTGSRFILIKRIDNTGDWFVWDTARGITPTTDPHLSLNSLAAEVTTDDSIDQDASGFVVNQNAATNINALGGNYLFLAIA